MTENDDSELEPTESTHSNTRRDILRAASASPVALLPGLSKTNIGKPRAIEIRKGYLPKKDLLSDDLSYPVGLGCSHPPYHVLEQGVHVTPFADGPALETLNDQGTIVLSEQLHDPGTELWSGNDRRISLYPELGTRTVSNLHTEELVEKPSVKLRNASKAPAVTIDSTPKPVGKNDEFVENLDPIRVKVTAEKRTLDSEFDGDPKTDSPVIVEEIEKEIALTPVVAVKDHGRMDISAQPPK